LALLHPRLCSELPPELPDETVFVTDVPSSSFQAMGRRDPTTGELCLYAIIHGAQRDDAPSGVEIVTGPEAEDLIRQIQLTDPTLNLH
jgi:streptogramin lyase